MKKSALFWFRQDLRLLDNPGLYHALIENDLVIPIYIHDKNAGGNWKIGSASKWWLHHSLSELQKQCPLVIIAGDIEEELRKLLKKTNAQSIYWNRCYEPHAIDRDKHLKQTLGIEAKSYNASLIHEPWEVKQYQIFTPYWKACLNKGIIKDTYPKVQAFPSHDIKGVSIDSLKLLPTAPNWASEFANNFSPGENGALKALDTFILNDLKSYADGRNIPAEVHTSKLSPHLHFGEISPRVIVDTISNAYGENGSKFLSEIGWREFSYHLLYYFPELPTKSFKANFENYPWQYDPLSLQKWQKGQTGYPIVDAGMRELWHTGYMHNRVRMITASFLIKDLQIDWREGAKWFWDTLVDADLANNSASWQWVAGSGVDASPYYRIFNPTLQGEKFDSEGKYVKKWVPELQNVPTKFIHKPWELPPASRPNYCNRIVDHEFARKLALDNYRKIRKKEG